MSYIIIGGDGKEYGPITAEDVRQWIAEGRLNALSLAKSVSDAEFRTLDKFPEFADIWGGSTPGTIAPLSSASVSDEDYELDLGGCIARGWELVKKNFGTLFGCILVIAGIQIAFYTILNVTMIAPMAKIFHAPAASVGLGLITVVLDAVVLGPLLGGIYLIYLKTIRGEATGLSEIFGGFQNAFARLFLGQLIVGLIGGICMVPFSFVSAEKINPLLQKLQTVQTQNAAPSEVGNIMSQMFSAYASALPVLLVCLIPLTYLTVCLQFTLPLIADKKMDIGTAIKTSWKQVSRHWWLVFGLTVLVALVSFAGGLACCIGVVFTAPIGFAALMFGYETIFNGKKY
jgi:hypothetical protein